MFRTNLPSGRKYDIPKLQSANQLIKKARYNEAEVLLNSCVMHDVFWHTAMAKCAIGQKNFETAELHLAKLPKHSSNEVYIMRADCLSAKGHFFLATTMLQKISGWEKIPYLLVRIASLYEGCALHSQDVSFSRASTYSALNIYLMLQKHLVMHPPVNLYDIQQLNLAIFRNRFSLSAPKLRSSDAMTAIDFYTLEVADFLYQQSKFQEAVFQYQLVPDQLKSEKQLLNQAGCHAALEQYQSACHLYNQLNSGRSTGTDLSEEETLESSEGCENAQQVANNDSIHYRSP